MPKFIVTHGSLKHGGKSIPAGEAVELTADEAKSLPAGVVMLEADFAKLLGTSLAHKLKSLKEERRSDSMKVKPEAPTAPLAKPQLSKKEA